jgi:hypothetical protein
MADLKSAQFHWQGFGWGFSRFGIIRQKYTNCSLNQMSILLYTFAGAAK